MCVSFTCAEGSDEGEREGGSYDEEEAACGEAQEASASMLGLRCSSTHLNSRFSSVELGWQWGFCIAACAMLLQSDEDDIEDDDDEDWEEEIDVDDGTEEDDDHEHRRPKRRPKVLCYYMCRREGPAVTTWRMMMNPSVMTTTLTMYAVACATPTRRTLTVSVRTAHVYQNSTQRSGTLFDGRSAVVRRANRR